MSLQVHSELPQPVLALHDNPTPIRTLDYRPFTEPLPHPGPDLLDRTGVGGTDTNAPSGAPRIPENDLFFGSKHPGIANFCFADGSVHALAETIDFTIFEDLATRADGEHNPWTP